HPLPRHRHSAASLLFMAGADAVAVQKLMRHANLRLTTETYGHLAPDYLQQEISKLCSSEAQRAELVPLAVVASAPRTARLRHEDPDDDPPGGGGGISARPFGCFRIDSGRTRTCYPRLRRPVLYPDELRSHRRRIRYSWPLVEEAPDSGTVPALDGSPGNLEDDASDVTKVLGDPAHRPPLVGAVRPVPLASLLQSPGSATD